MTLLPPSVGQAYHENAPSIPNWALTLPAEAGSCILGMTVSFWLPRALFTGFQLKLSPTKVLTSAPPLNMAWAGWAAYLPTKLVMLPVSPFDQYAKSKEMNILKLSCCAAAYALSSCFGV